MLVLNRLLLNREYVVTNALKALGSIVSMCDLHVIFLSNITPRYFTLFINEIFRPFSVRRDLGGLIEFQNYFMTDSQSVSQYVLVFSTLVGLATKYYFLSECCCLKFAVVFLWGALSDERTGLQFAV
jgi:hypothetical protein